MEAKAKKIDQRAAYCGLYCGSCPVFIATRESGGMKTKEGGTLSCSGCRSDDCPSWCLDCELKKCARKREMAFCVDCADYPCEPYVGFRDASEYPYHAECPAYLEEIKAKGAPAWLGDMEAKWTCPDCGRPASWWDKKCKACGVPMPGFDEP